MLSGVMSGDAVLSGVSCVTPGNAVLSGVMSGNAVWSGGMSCVKSGAPV